MTPDEATRAGDEATPRERADAEHTDAESPVLAMQLAVRVDRTTPPTVTNICRACALATIALLDDPRSQPGGPWHDPVAAWNQVHIRKLVRRGRGQAWQRAHDAPGVTVAIDDTEARAFVPGPVDNVHPSVAKLQIQSTELPAPPIAASLEPTPGLHIAVSPSVDMSWGKRAAQCAHAAQRAWLTAPPYTLAAWESTGRPIEVVQPSQELWAQLVDEASTHIHDGGYTEIPAGTLTAVAWWSAPVPRV